MSLLDQEPVVVTAGVSLFAEALAVQAVGLVGVDWRPPPEEVAGDLARVMGDPRHADANAVSVARMLAAGARVVDVRPAGEALGLDRGTFLHAGPPITWDQASGPLRGALQGAMVFEGLADDTDAAQRLLASSVRPATASAATEAAASGSATEVAAPGPVSEAAATESATVGGATESAAVGGATESAAIVLDSCHHHGAVGPMAGVISPSMWVFELEDPVSGRRAWCPLNEGLGKVLRYGAYSSDVIDRLSWMSTVLGPLLQHAVRTVRDAGAAIDVKAVIAQMLQMGDEGHHRNRAGTLLLLRELLPAMLEAPGAASGPAGQLSSSDVVRAVKFIAGNDHFFLSLVMPACKLATDAGRDVPGSSVVVAMARNGTDFGIQVSGTGDRWFTGPANTPEGLYLGDFGPEDANPDLGDAAITETAGLGGFAMAAAPAIVRFVGGDVPFAFATSRRMQEITVAENPAFAIPVLEFRGTPTGIDVASVVRTGILPQINTGLAGRVAGTGQIGAGLVNPPPEIFSAALHALAELAPPL